jgi:WD40 repeat protein
VGDRILDQYEILGSRRGGMGIVYRARHLGWGVDVAVKRPQPHQGDIDTGQFAREARTWVGLGLHPNVCHCHYVRTIDGLPSIVAEYVDTGCLADWIGDGRLYQGDRRQVLARVLDIAIQTVRSLEHAHANGVLHRDVKPANILIEADHTVKLCDFGIAGAYRSVGGMNRAYRGTRHYASPEQAAGEPLGPASDLWSFAVTVLEMVVGGVTWLAGPAAGQALTERRPEGPMGAVPEALTELLSRCLAWEPDRRPGGTGEVLTALLALFAAKTGRPYPRTPPAPARPRADELNNRALSLLDLGRPGEARDAFDEALAADPRHLEASFNRGLLRWRTGEATDDVLIEDLRAAQANGADPARVRHLIDLVERERGPSSPRFTIPVTRELLSPEAALSPDGALLVIGESTGKVTLINTAAGAPVRAWFGPDDPVRVIRVDSSGRRVFTSFMRGNVSSWEFSTGLRVGGKAGTGAIDSRICIAPDARLTVETFTETRRRARVWRIDRSRPAHRLAVTGPTTAAAVTPDAHWALFADESGSVAAWDLIERRRRFVLRVHDHPIDDIAVDPHGRYAVTTVKGFEDYTARVVDLREGRLAAVLAGHRAPISALAVSRDGTIALTGSGDGTVRIWDLAEGTCLRLLTGHTNTVVSADLADTTLGVAVTADTDGATRIWELASGRCLRTVSSGTATISKVLASATGQFVVRAGRDAVDAWTLAASRNAPFQPCRSRTAIELSDTDALVDGLIQDALQSNEEGDAEQALTTLQSARSQPGHERTAEIMAAWHRVVPAAGPGTFRTAWVSRVIPGSDGDRVTDMCVTPDGAHVLSAGHPGNAVRVHAFDSGELEAELTGHTDTVLAVCTDPTGRFAITGGLDGTVRVWDLRTGEQVRILTEPHGSVLAVCVTPDGLVAAAGSDATVRLWDMATGSLVHSFADHFDRVVALCTTPDGRDLLVADPASVSRWDLPTGRCTSVPERLSGIGLAALAVTADNMLLTFEFPHRAKVRVRDLSTARFVGLLEHNRSAGHLSMTAIPGTAYALTAESDAVRVWHPAHGRSLGQIDSPPGGARAIAASPDGQHFLTAGNDGAIRIWTIDWGIGDPQG